MSKGSRTQSLLIGESFSPWTKKARWALEYCELDFAYKEYTPTLSEPGLRWRLRQLRGPVSVPVLCFGEQICHDSWEIACFANDMAGDGRLGDMDAIRHWDNLSESALAEGRTRVVRCILGNEKALEESLPTFVPKQLRPALRFVARDAVQRLDRKYAHLLNTGALREALFQLREGLARSESDFLLGSFTYADISMATVMEVVDPIAHSEPALGSSTQHCWNDLALADEFKDLLDWRCRLAETAATTYSQFRSEQSPV